MKIKSHNKASADAAEHQCSTVSPSLNMENTRAPSLYCVPNLKDVNGIT
jgi:hypothetical protein